MFQFRAFPSYGYLIHRTITEYCSVVLPHSEISGSRLICSSPKLFAACHVLHRLLMPRHSPCALISLTCKNGSHHFSGSLELCRFNRSCLTKLYLPFVRENCASLRPPCGEHPFRSASFSSSTQTRLRWALRRDPKASRFPRSGSLELCRFNRSV